MDRHKRQANSQGKHNTDLHNGVTTQGSDCKRNYLLELRCKHTTMECSQPRKPDFLVFYWFHNAVTTQGRSKLQESFTRATVDSSQPKKTQFLAFCSAIVFHIQQALPKNTNRKNTYAVQHIRIAHSQRSSTRAVSSHTLQFMKVSCSLCHFATSGKASMALDISVMPGK